jgi:hypothetical protein
MRARACRPRRRGCGRVRAAITSGSLSLGRREGPAMSLQRTRGLHPGAGPRSPPSPAISRHLSAAPLRHASKLPPWAPRAAPSVAAAALFARQDALTDRPSATVHFDTCALAQHSSLSSAPLLCALIGTSGRARLPDGGHWCAVLSGGRADRPAELRGPTLTAARSRSTAPCRVHPCSALLSVQVAAPASPTAAIGAPFSREDALTGRPSCEGPL